MYQKNDFLEIEITDMSNEGEGIGKVDGFTFFVKDAIIGDKATIRVTKVKKTYGYGRLENIIEPSKDRITGKCPYARQCGGCQIQNMSYEAQLKFKENKVKNNLIRLGGFDRELIDSLTEPIIGAIDEQGNDYQFGYRNKAQFPFGKDKENRVITGFYAGRTHSIISNTECFLGVPENKLILEAILQWMKDNRISAYDEVSGSGFLRHTLIRKGFRTGEIMVCLVINSPKMKAVEALANRLISLNSKLKDIFGSRIESISFSTNTKNTNVIMGDNYSLIWGKETIDDIMKVGGRELKFSISPLSFYQVNPIQVEKLYGTAIEYAGLTGKEEVWDLCCGIGTITLAMADHAKKVHGIEIVPEAIEDAIKNAKENNINNAKFICAPAEEYLAEHAEDISADVIVMDPPRKGMDEKALEVVARTSPSRIVYVSCDSATLARDLKYLCDRGYEIRKIRPVDMFSQTVHVETVCLLASGPGGRG